MRKMNGKKMNGKKLVATMLMCSVAVNVMTFNTVNSISADEDTVLTSSEIKIFGSQIKMSTESTTVDSITYRMIGKAPKAGEQIEAGGNTYTVERVGMIYVLDDNKTGKAANTVLGDEYTLLDETSLTGSGSNEYFVGRYQYKGKNRTFGYLASDQGMVPGFKSQDREDGDKDNLCYYVRTMTNMDAIVANTMIQRPFVLCTDGTIIYGEKIEKASVAEIAKNAYIGGKIGDRVSFNYVFDNILHTDYMRECSEKYGNRCYLEEPEEWGWSPIVSPGDLKKN